MRALLLGGLLAATAIACAAGSSGSDPTAPSPASPSSAASSVGAACAGPEVDWSAVPAIVEAYGRAWNERDPEIRLEFLEESLADEASYVDVTMDRPVVGRTAISDMIGVFHVDIAGHYFEPRGWADGDDHHHDRYRMRWRFCDDADNIILAGEDIGVVGDDGRFVELVGWHE
jgi:hypothetical protein